VRATALQLSDIACRILHTLYSNSVIALTQFPGDMPPASCIFRAAVISAPQPAFKREDEVGANCNIGARMRRIKVCCTSYPACCSKKRACQRSPLTLVQRLEQTRIYSLDAPLVRRSELVTLTLTRLRFAQSRSRNELAAAA
jgi:hypothetical protein